MKKLLIFPYNGNGLEAIDCLSDEYELIGFIDDQKEKQGLQANKLKVFSRDSIAHYPEAKILAVPGSPTTYLNRKKIIDSLGLPANRFATVIHKNASISSLATFGYNILIGAGVVITSNASIGNHVCILPNSVIHHHVEIADFCLVGANVTIAGGTKIGNNCYLGSGSSVINNIVIGQKSLVGLGSNVIKSLPSNSKAVGNPAYIIGEVS
jgi:UDP-3-O-[3-hydroxymyristoyl] glucosamine N-acyltransferase